MEFAFIVVATVFTLMAAGIVATACAIMYAVAEWVRDFGHARDAQFRAKIVHALNCAEF